MVNLVQKARILTAIIRNPNTSCNSIFTVLTRFLLYMTIPSLKTSRVTAGSVKVVIANVEKEPTDGFTEFTLEGLRKIG